MLDPGTLIANRYVIDSPLASGGSGLVYSATDRTTEKRVAIKIVGQHVLHERAAREKLRLEAIVAGRVESENVVQVSDAGVDAATGYPFLVMELLKGNDLQHWVIDHGPLDGAIVHEYLRQVASGLDKSHSWKDSDRRTVPIVHRDLKPENLFLTHREDGTPVVKILDFGLAKVLSGSATLSSEVRGTPLYMAPEQLTQGPITPATDIWALGLIAFFLLTGKCYWKSAQNADAVLPAVIKEVADGPSAAPRARLAEFSSDRVLPEAFDGWFLRCVNLDPGARFASAGEAVKALGVALGIPQKSSPLAANRVPLDERHTPVDVANARSQPNSDAAAPHSDSHAPALSAPSRPAKSRSYWRVALVLLGGLFVLWVRSHMAHEPLAAHPAATPSATSTENLAAASELPRADAEPPSSRVERQPPADAGAFGRSSTEPAPAATKAERTLQARTSLTPRAPAKSAASAQTATKPSAWAPAPETAVSLPQRIDPADHR